jgi:membrane protease YdiL (CAAX protease family)
MLAGVAGVGYGLAYQMTGGRLEASMAAHFTLNTVHFLLFTYPRIA